MQLWRLSISKTNLKPPTVRTSAWLDLICISILVSTGLVESVVRYCCLCIVVFCNLVTFAMQENIEQRYDIKFCVKLKKSATETFVSLTEAYGDATLLRTMVFKWHKAFREGRENVDEDPRSGRPISSTNDQNVEVVWAVMAKDRRLSVRMIAQETVNHAFYKDILERLRKRVQRVRRDIADEWVLHHDNAPAHTALSIREFLAKKNVPVIPHPPYSPDLAPCDFSLYPKLKSKLKNHNFGTMENIQKIVTDELHTYGIWLPVLLWSVEKTLEPLCNFPRVILWRR